MKHSLSSGFTFVELMVVIAIIGILAGTFLPKLIGGQARARDVSRIQDLNTLTVGLETIYSDIAEYPASDSGSIDVLETGTVNCVSSSTGATAHRLNATLKSIPLDPNGATVTTGVNCGVSGAYAYTTLSDADAPNKAYVLVADTETWPKANYDASGSTAIGDSITLDEARAEWTLTLTSKSPSSFTADDSSLYIVIR